MPRANYYNQYGFSEQVALDLPFFYNSFLKVFVIIIGLWNAL